MRGWVMAAALLAGCAAAPPPVKSRPKPVVTTAWDAARFGTYDNAEFARLFTDVGGYSVVSDDGQTMRLQQNGVGAEIVLEQLPPDAPQARPPDAQSWEPGCYWSLMVRARNLESIVADAKPLGWEPRTPIAFLEFGPSQLHIVVLTHQETGAQVQFYERLTTPLPDGYPEFDRFGVPFNIMQMASDRDATHRFFTYMLGFATFYHGEPSLSDEPEVNPLGISEELTTTVPYVASIVSPVADMETGRFEMIEVMGEDAGLEGRDFSEKCTSASVGLTHVSFEAEPLEVIGRIHQATLAEYPLESENPDVLNVSTPDGANIRFRAR